MQTAAGKTTLLLELAQGLGSEAIYAAADGPNAGQGLTYWREEPFEVDAVLDGSWGRWALEVKTGRFDQGQLHGLAEFTRRYPRYRPLVLCDAEQTKGAECLGIAAADWRRFLLEGLTI